MASPSKRCSPSVSPGSGPEIKPGGVVPPLTLNTNELHRAAPNEEDEEGDFVFFINEENLGEMIGDEGLLGKVEAK
jgi:hypothetical protein